MPSKKKYLIPLSLLALSGFQACDTGSAPSRGGAESRTSIAGSTAPDIANSAANDVSQPRSAKASITPNPPGKKTAADSVHDKPITPAPAPAPADIDTSSSAHDPLSAARKIEFSLGSDHRPEFSYTYAFDAIPTWKMTFSFARTELGGDGLADPIAWRLYDRGRSRFLTPWRTDLKRLNAHEASAPARFECALTDAATLPPENLSGKDLVLVISVSQDARAPIPTHFVSVGEYCLAASYRFLNERTNQFGCGKGIPVSPPSPPPALPTSSRQLIGTEMRAHGLAYCKGVDDLEREMIQSHAYPRDRIEELREAFRREKDVVQAVCDTYGFAGHREVTDLNARLVVDVAAMKDGYLRLQKLADVGRMPTQRELYGSHLDEVRRAETILVDRALLDAYPTSIVESADFRTRVEAFRRYGAALNEYHRAPTRDLDI